MRQFNYSDTDFVVVSGSEHVSLLTDEKTVELANALGLEVVAYKGDEDTVRLFSHDNSIIDKSSIKAIKYDDDLYFFYCKYTYSAPSYSFIIVDSDFNTVHNTNSYLELYATNACPSLWYIKTNNAIAFRTNYSKYDTNNRSAVLTKARTITGEYIPVGVYKTMASSNSNATYILGKNIYEYTNVSGSVSSSYNTLISLSKIMFPINQLICDYVYYPYISGGECSPKRMILNGETWLYTGTYSNNYAYQGLLIKIDE